MGLICFLLEFQILCWDNKLLAYYASFSEDNGVNYRWDSNSRFC